MGVTIANRSIDPCEMMLLLALKRAAQYMDRIYSNTLRKDMLLSFVSLLLGACIACVVFILTK